MHVPSSGIDSEIARAAERLEVVPGLVLPVATTAHLVLTKLLARDDDTRPQRAADLVALRRVATERDVEIVRQAIAAELAALLRQGDPAERRRQVLAREP